MRRSERLGKQQQVNVYYKINLEFRLLPELGIKTLMVYLTMKVKTVSYKNLSFGLLISLYIDINKVFSFQI
jgi:hypothetical protein